MAERLKINNLSDPIPDPDPFAPDFRKKMDRMILTGAVEVVAQETAKAAAAAIPLAILSSNNLPAEPINITITKPVIAGTVFGVGCAIEEAFEKGHESAGKKALAIIAKGTAGFLGAHSIATNMENGNSWISGENLPQTIALVPATYVLARETSLNQLLEGINNFRSKVSGDRKETRMQQEVARLLKQLRSSNITTSDSALEQLNSMLGSDLTKKLIRGRINAEDLSFKPQQPEKANGQENGGGSHRK